MPHPTACIFGMLILTSSILTIGCQNSGNSSDQSGNAAAPIGETVNVSDELVGLSTGGERQSANYRLQLSVREDAIGGSQQRASGSYRLTLGIGATQQVERGE